MGGDPPAPSTQESMASILQAYQQNLPGLIKATVPGMTDIAQGNVAAAQATGDPYAQLQQHLLQTYGPALAATEKNIDQSVNPEYYQTRSTISKGIQDLVGGMDPNKLSGSESAEVERGLNRLNPNQVNSPIKTVQNAATFGSALANKRAQFEQALGLATGALGPMTNQSVGQMAQTNFLGANQGAGQSGLQFGQGALNNATSLRQQQNDINAQRRDPLDRATQVLGSLPNIS